MKSLFIKGIVTDDWEQTISRDPRPRADLLQLWDEDTEKLNSLRPQIPLGRFQEEMTVFGQYSGRVYDHVLYVIDNEVHHRGQR